MILQGEPIMTKMRMRKMCSLAERIMRKWLWTTGWVGMRKRSLLNYGMRCAVAASAVVIGSLPVFALLALSPFRPSPALSAAFVLTFVAGGAIVTGGRSGLFHFDGRELWAAIRGDIGTAWRGGRGSRTLSAAVSLPASVCSAALLAEMYAASDLGHPIVALALFVAAVQINVTIASSSGHPPRSLMEAGTMLVFMIGAFFVVSSLSKASVPVT